jgi:Flp pilus assembly pilin Flp
MLTRTRMRFFDEESGQDTVEYGLLAALIAIASIVTIQAIGPLVNAMYKGIAQAISGGSVTAP